LIQTFKQTWTKTQKRVRAWLTNPAAELSRTSRTLRFLIHLSIHVTRQLKQDKAAQIAASLSFRTLFSLLPLTVVVLLVFKTLGLFDEALPALRDTVFRYLDLGASTSEQITVMQGVGAATSTWFAANTEALTPLHQFHERADAMINGLQSTLDRVNFGTLGWVGVVLFVWSALRLVISAEQSFNQIVKAPSQRGWTKRIVGYWALITLGPVLLVISLSAAGLVAKRFESLPILGQQAVNWANTLLAFGSAWLLFFLAYRYLPKRQLNTQALAVGAVVAALLWELWKHGFRIFLRHSFGSDGFSTNAALYGSVALLPVFFMWVQVTWMFVLFGLSFAYSLHALPSQSRFVTTTAAQEAGVVDARWTIPVLACVAQAFKDGEPLSAERIGALTALPQPAVDRILQSLLLARLVYEVSPPEDDEDDADANQPESLAELSNAETISGFALAAPAETVSAHAVMTVIRKLADNTQAADDLPGMAAFRAMLTEEKQPTSAQTLKDLIDDRNYQNA